jgi:hypothetical protein
MDVWEHAFILDYPPAERPKYIEAFFANIDWDVATRRLGSRPRQRRGSVALTPAPADWGTGSAASPTTA